MERTLYLLTGPTASGKESAAMRLAERLGGEIVSVDSMKIYRGMDIGTAKAPAEARRKVRHHMVDVAEPSETFSVAEYLAGAVEAERKICNRGRFAIFSGGTPLYIRGLLHGLFDGPAADWEIRRELLDRAEREGNESLHEELKRLDPEAAARIHPNDLKRVTRAIEVARITGEPISDRQTQLDSLARPARVAVLRREPDDLRHRIERRVDRMLEAGLVAEARALRDRLSRTAREGVGYKEILGYLDGEGSLSEARDRICARTWRMARKQMTWFRNLSPIRWFDVSSNDEADSVAERVEAFWKVSDA